MVGFPSCVIAGGGFRGGTVRGVIGPAVSCSRVKHVLATMLMCVKASLRLTRVRTIGEKAAVTQVCSLSQRRG